MEALLMGLALAFNILVIIWKIRNRGLLDGLLDASLLAVVMTIAGGTLTGMLVGTIASAVVSAYLLVYPLEVEIKLPRLSGIRFPKISLPTFSFKMPSFRWPFTITIRRTHA